MTVFRWPTAARPPQAVGRRAFGLLLVAGSLLAACREVRPAGVAALVVAPGAGASASTASDWSAGSGAVRPPLLSPAFHRGRREALRRRLPAHSVAVLFAGPVRNMAADVDYPFHQDPDFYYLTGLREPGAVLVLFADPQPNPDGGGRLTELLFVRPRNAFDERWNGPRLGPAAAARDLAFGQVRSSADFGRQCPDLRAFAQVLFMPPPDEGRDMPADSTELADLGRHFRQLARLPADFDPAREQTYALLRRPVRRPAQLRAQLADRLLTTPALRSDPLLRAYLTAPTDAARAVVLSNAPPPGHFDVTTLDELLNDLREIKQPEELLLLRYAIDVTVTGHMEALRALTPASAESALDGVHLHVYRHFGATATGYAPIVGAGANGCVLHYIANDKPRVAADLVVMDVGAAYGGYTADVTRTAPGNGSFSPEQRAIYELVLKAQEAGLAACKPGNSFFGPGEAATRVIAQGLQKLGLIAHPDSVVRYFPHGTSHYLGLDVHDRGTYGPLRPNSVITVEPGIYIPPGSPCDRRWWGLGCRIEDDVLITAGGYENLSGRLPRTAAAIEKLVAEPSGLENWLK